MLSALWGIEVEFTGVTRQRAAEVAAEVLGSTARHIGGGYDAWHVEDQSGRTWKFVYDSSIVAQKKEQGRRVPAGNEYKVEMVSPILTYREDIDTLQNLIRALRKARAFPGSTCGIHIHLNGADHTPRSVRNFVNIVAARNGLFYKALQIEPERMRYCKQMDEFMVERMNRKKPKTFDEIKEIWYEGYYGDRNSHYHESRYFFANLHSFFQGNRTIELRGFNAGDSKGMLHAGVIRAYVMFALALNHQALTQKSARSKKVQSDNEKFCMRTFLVRIGFKGDEFKNCREHLCKHLSGNAAWRFGPAA